MTKILRMDLISRVRRGEINFERFVDILRSQAYITEEHQVDGCGFGSSAMEAVRKDDFEALFTFFFTEEVCDIEVSCGATDKGGVPGAYSYALFNSKAITRDEILDVLRAENAKTLSWLQGET